MAAKMPLKKRGKLAPATPPSDSGDESSEFEEEFDKDLFKDEEDRKWMMVLSEVDRQGILAERQEKQNIAREAWQLEHMKKKAGEDPPRTRIKIRRQRKLDDTGTIEQVTDPLCSSVIWKIPQASQMWTHISDADNGAVFRYFFLIVGGFYSEVALRNERQRAQCILNTS